MPLQAVVKSYDSCPTAENGEKTVKMVKMVKMVDRLS
jgi:hypothetical protein